MGKEEEEKKKKKKKKYFEPFQKVGVTTEQDREGTIMLQCNQNFIFSNKPSDIK